MLLKNLLSEYLLFCNLHELGEDYAEEMRDSEFVKALQKSDYCSKIENELLREDTEKLLNIIRKYWEKEDNNYGY